MTALTDQPVYELSVNIRTDWQAHSISNAGNNGSNRLLGRRVMLADGTETDAGSGNSSKHQHASVLTEYLEDADLPLCPACASRDGRRAAALVGRSDYKDLTIHRILTECALCDAHGFLITGKNATGEDTTQTRQRTSKHSLIEFGWALALPEQHAETSQLMTRVGDSKEDGQMLMKVPCRSGAYAFNVRYKSVGIGVDTDKWVVIVTDEVQRRKRHQAILAALCDQILSPSGAMTATMLPHLTRVVGAIVIRTTAGRAPLYSALQSDFVERLTALANDSCLVLPCTSIDTFYQQMHYLMNHSYPCLPRTKGSAH